MVGGASLPAWVIGSAPAHLGELHGYEQGLVLLLAFGPFAVLAVVVFLLRRRDIAEEASEAEHDEPVGSA